MTPIATRLGQGPSPIANRFVSPVFSILVVVAQIGNVIFWRGLAPLFGALSFNLAGAAMQFVHFNRSAFHD